MHAITVGERRDLLMRRHHLGGDAAGPDEVAQAMIALHATDAATVYLSVLARSHRSTLTDVSESLYQRRSLVRWMAMRRTLFVFPVADIPCVHAAVSTPVAAALRRQLVSRMRRNGTDPATGDPQAWLAGVEIEVETALRAAGSATGARLGAAVPALRTTILAGSRSDRPQNVTSPLLTMMGTAGRIVRGTATGAWTSRHHEWEPVGRWWPDGLPHLEALASQREIARRWLERFGPATLEDLQWWTGWNKTITYRAVTGLPVEEVDLDGRTGVIFGADLAPAAAERMAPAAALLPSLDPTSMGWKHRDWYLGIDSRLIYDSAGNIGPTVWWSGEIIGSWAVAASGEVRTAVIADRGSDAAAAVQAAAELLQSRLAGSVVTPAIRTHLERSLL